MNDNLFDARITFLDVVKVLLLVVTAFSTWNVVDLMTPDGSLSFVREIAAVGVVEGVFLGFEFATAKAKSARQVKLATIGFFCSLAVIGLFAGLSGLLEFGGEALLNQPAGEWLGLAWTARDVVMTSSLAVLVAWIIGLASIYRLYSLADPDKILELSKIRLRGEVSEEANKALKLALNKAKPVIARTRAEASIRADYENELNQEQLEGLAREVSAYLARYYGLAAAPKNGAAIPADPEMPFLPRQESPAAGAPFRSPEED